jgi:hypothetical protein
MHATNNNKMNSRDAGRATPSEGWKSQRKTAWAKLARSETPDQQAEDFAEQTITEHSPAQEQTSN